MSYLEAIKKNVLADMQWTEKAILVLDDHNAWEEEDVVDGPKIAAFIRSRRENKVPLGQCCTSDYWCGRARKLVQKYPTKLLQLAMFKAQKELETHIKKAEKTKKRLFEITKELDGQITYEYPEECR